MKITITESELKSIVNECVMNVLEKKGLISEMALSRQGFITRCDNYAEQALIHIGKIISFENNEKYSHYVKHWKEELSAFIFSCVKCDILNDDKQGTKKKRYFTEGFINHRLGENMSEYHESMYSYVSEAIENFPEEDIKGMNSKQIAKDNDQRIYSYLNNIVELLSIQDKDELKNAIKELTDNF